MAVLFAPQAAETVCDALDRSDRPCTGAVSTLHRLLTGPLPADVPDDEYTVAALFRASLVLNFMTGGAANMTFSARCHRSGRVSRKVTQRALWRMTGAGIDIACAVLRGEREHCATAWANHRARSLTGRRTVIGA